MPSLTNPITAWLLVLLSGLLEVAFSTAMKLSEGYTRLPATAASVVAGIASVWLMSQTLRLIPLGTAYAVWAGIGAVGTAAVGIAWFHEPLHAGRLACIGLVVAGIVGLQLLGGD